MDATIIPSAAAAARLPISVPILVRTNIGTNISFTVSEEDTIRDLKRRIVMEHANIHPDIGDINILHLKVKWGKSLFSLSNSMSVRDAFHWKKGAWILYVDASSAIAARDMVATSVDNQRGANGGGCTGSFKVACKDVNDGALGKDKGISKGRSKSPAYECHQQDPSISMDKIIEASNDIVTAEEKVQTSGNMDGIEITTASVAREIGGDKSNIHSISVSATELADPFSEPHQNPTQTEEKMKENRNSEQCAAFEKDNCPDGLINSSIAGISDFNILEKPTSRNTPDSPQSGNALTINRQSSADISKAKLPDTSSATRFDEVSEISTVPEGSNLEISRKRKKKSSHSRKNLIVRDYHGMIDISSAADENVSDIRKIVEKSPPLSEPMDKQQSLSPHIVSTGRATEKSKDGMDMMIESVATKAGGNSSDIHEKFFETVELADQFANPQKTAIRTKKKKKSRKCSELSAASGGTDENRLSNSAMTVAIDSHTVEMPHSGGVPDSLLDVNTLSRGRETPAENLKVYLPSGKRTGTGYAEEFADISQNPKEDSLEVHHKRKRKSSSHQKKISSHGTSDTVSAAPENANHARMAPGESAASSDMANKKQKQNDKNDKILEVSPLDLEKESPLGIQAAEENPETDHTMKGLGDNQMPNTHLLGKVGESHEKESNASPLLDKTPIGRMSPLLLALPVSMEKKQPRKRKKSENAEEVDANSLELEKGSFSGIKGTGKDLEDNNLNNGLGSEFLEGINGSHDKQSNGLLLERACDALPVDEQNCSSILLGKCAVSSDAMTKKLQQNKKKNEKFKAENVKSSKLCCLENQDPEESLEAYCLNESSGGNANTDFPGEVNGSHDEKYNALLLLDKTPNYDPAGEVKTDDGSEIPRTSIDKSVFMEIFSPRELETSLTVEESPSTLKSGRKKPSKASRTPSRKSNTPNEGDSANNPVNYSQAKHKKKSRLDKLSDPKENSDGSTCQENLQEENANKRPGTNAGIFTADGERDTKPTLPNKGRKQVKSLSSKVDTLIDMDSPVASGKNAVSKNKGHSSMNKGKDSVTQSGATAYPGQTHAGVTTSLKIAAPSLSSASTEDNSPISTSRYRVAVRQNSHEMSGKSSGAAGQDGVFSARDTFFDDLNNESLENEHGADNRAANSGSELNHETQQEIQFPNAQVIDYRDSVSMKNVDTKNRSGKNSTGSRPKGGQFKLSTVLRNTKAYKKASAIIASQSQELL